MYQRDTYRRSQWVGSRAPVGFKFSRLAVRPRPRRLPGQRRCHQYRESKGADVAQLYVGDPAATGEPAEQLKGFQRVTLRPRQTTRVAVTSSLPLVARAEVTR